MIPQKHLDLLLDLDTDTNLHSGGALLDHQQFAPRSLTSDSMSADGHPRHGVAGTVEQYREQRCHDDTDSRPQLG